MKIFEKIKNIFNNKQVNENDIIVNKFDTLFENFFLKSAYDFEQIKEYETRIRGEYYISKEEFLGILKTELDEDYEKLQKYFNSFYSPMGEIDNAIFELRGEYVQCCTSDPARGLTPGKRYKKIKQGTDWYIGNGILTYAIINDEGKEKDYLFFEFINLGRNKFTAGLKDIFN